MDTTDFNEIEEEKEVKMNGNISPSMDITEIS